MRLYNKFILISRFLGVLLVLFALASQIIILEGLIAIDEKIDLNY